MLDQALDRWVAATLTDFSPLVLVLLWTLCPVLSTTPLLLCAPPTLWRSWARVSFPPIVFLRVGVLCVCLSLIVRLSPFSLLCAEVTFAIGRTFKSKSYPRLLTIFMLPKCMLTWKSMDRSACSDCGWRGGGGGDWGGVCVCVHMCACACEAQVCVYMHG